jgi:catechol 2,3-dioxygenase-like lactoylglutathione lyase family enzyme
MDARPALIILAVSDLPRAVQFYRTAFGWPQEVDVPVYAEFAMPGDQRLGLYERVAFGRNTGQAPGAMPDGALTGTELYFYPHDLPAAIARLEAAGAHELSRLTRRDWGDEAAYFADPDGNVLVMARPLRHR